MTLDKHKLDGVPQITAKILPASEFEILLANAGYTKIGTAPAKGSRIKTWWSHLTFRRIEAIYSLMGQSPLLPHFSLSTFVTISGDRFNLRFRNFNRILRD